MYKVADRRGLLHIHNAWAMVLLVLDYWASQSL